MVGRLALFGLFLLTGACSGDSRPSSGGANTLSIFAAASLTEVFRDLARDFPLSRSTRGPGEEPAEPEVLLNLAGSQTLAAQILADAPADAFASADAAQMERVARGGRLAAEPVVFAENGLAIVTESGNPHHIRKLSDLARPELVVVIAAPEVPVGAYTREALARAGVKVQPASLEADVKQVLAKVVLGEADAGIVYRTDVLAAGESVHGIPLAEEIDVQARYRIAPIRNAAASAQARDFIEFLVSPRGRELLRSYGFQAPAGDGQDR